MLIIRPKQQLLKLTLKCASQIPQITLWSQITYWSHWEGNGSGSYRTLFYGLSSVQCTDQNLTVSRGPRNKNAQSTTAWELSWQVKLYTSYSPFILARNRCALCTLLVLTSELSYWCFHHYYPDKTLFLGSNLAQEPSVPASPLLQSESKHPQRELQPLHSAVTAGLERNLGSTPAHNTTSTLTGCD